jgi:ECF sigma factor
LKNDVTQILAAIEQGDPKAAEQLLPLVYDELRNLAIQKLGRVPPGQTLQPTALVHEAYLRLVGGGQQIWDTRGDPVRSALRRGDRPTLRSIRPDARRVAGFGSDTYAARCGEDCGRQWKARAHNRVVATFHASFRRHRAPQHRAQGCLAERFAQRPVGPEGFHDLGRVVLRPT